VPAGSTFIEASCTGATENGTPDGNGVAGLMVGTFDIVTCTFYNKPVETQPVCDANASHTIVSDTLTLKGEAPAVAVSPINAFWTAAIADAIWIWGENPVADPVAATAETFTRAFTIVGAPLGATLTVAADNAYEVVVNGHSVGSDATEFNFAEEDKDSITIAKEDLLSGTNTLSITVTNKAMENGTTELNPAGLLYSLTTNANECAVPPAQTYTIVATQGDHGSITPAGTTVVTSGGSQAFTMTPESGYVLADVVVDGVSQGATASYTFSNINANHTITASFSAIQEPEPGSDLVLTKVVDDATPDVGQTIVYTITVTNDGLDDATGVTVADVLPAGLSFVATSTEDTLGVYSAGVWTIGDLAAEATAVLHITARVTGEEGDVIQNVATAAVGEQSSDPDEENNTNDPSSASLTVNTAAVTPPVTPPSGGGGGGGGGGSCAPGFVFNPVTIKCDPVGQVLGASTVGQGQVLGASCGLYMDRYVKRGGAKNNAEQVTKLQNFLNKHGFGNFTSTGFFGPLTEAAVKAFQQKYADEVLKPWNLTGPTGIAYLTTLRQVNLIECPELMIPVPTLVPWSANVHAE